MVTLIGLLGEHPPTDEQGFLDFTGTLPARDIYEVVKEAEPLTAPVPFRFPASSRRSYERMKRFPEGYLVFGDAMVDTPWMIAVGGDLRYPGVEGSRTPMMRFVNWYLGKLHVAARRDPQLTLAFHKVANLLAEPPSLLHPKVALRVLRGSLGLPGPAA